MVCNCRSLEVRKAAIFKKKKNLNLIPDNDDNCAYILPSTFL